MQSSINEVFWYNKPSYVDIQLMNHSYDLHCWQSFFFLMGDVSNLFFPQKCLPVTPAFVMSVRDAFENQRPAKRQKKVLDQHQKFVLSQPNFCFLEKNCGTLKRETITLEIKVRKTYLMTSKNIIILCYLLCFPSDEWKMWSYKERFT